MNNLKISRAAIRKGLKTVINRYTDEISKLAMLAKFPVPKKATLKSTIKIRGILTSESRKYLSSVSRTAFSTMLILETVFFSVLLK